jgi:hypothetical protein
LPRCFSGRETEDEPRKWPREGRDSGTIGTERRCASPSPFSQVGLDKFT